MGRPDPAFRAATRDARALRRVGRFVMDEEPVGRDGAEAARLRMLARLGYRDIGEDWVPMDLDRTRDTLWWILHRDLAYDYAFGDSKAADALAGRLVDLLGAGRWYTNGDTVAKRVHRFRTQSDSYRSASWEPLSAATFDAGALFVGPTRVAIVWVEDED